MKLVSRSVRIVIIYIFVFHAQSQGYTVRAIVALLLHTTAGLTRTIGLLLRQKKMNFNHDHLRPNTTK